MITCFNQIGLLFALIGSILIVLSVRRNRSRAHSVDEKGREIYLAEISHPFAIKVGIFFLIIGFLLQLVVSFFVKG